MFIDRHLIIEGENGTGKSSLISHLMSRFDNVIYHHFMFPKGDTIDEQYGYQRGQFELMFDLMKSVQRNDQFFIFDRAHIGEYVWSPIYRKCEPRYLSQLENDNKDIPLLLINVTCDPEVIQWRFRTSRQSEKCPTIEELTQNQNIFLKYLEKSPFPLVQIDTTHTRDPDITKILEVMNDK